MDQFAVALGREGHALHVATETLAYDPIALPGGVRVVVYHTGVEREPVDEGRAEEFARSVHDAYRE